MLWAKLSHNPGGVPGILSGTRVIAQDKTVDFHRWKPRISSYYIFFWKIPPGSKWRVKNKSPVKEEQQLFFTWWSTNTPVTSSKLHEHGNFNKRQNVVFCVWWYLCLGTFRGNLREEISLRIRQRKLLLLIKSRYLRNSNKTVMSWTPDWFMTGSFFHGSLYTYPI